MHEAKLKVIFFKIWFASSTKFSFRASDNGSWEHLFGSSESLMHYQKEISGYISDAGRAIDLETELPSVSSKFFEMWLNFHFFFLVNSIIIIRNISIFNQNIVYFIRHGQKKHWNTSRGHLKNVDTFVKTKFFLVWKSFFPEIKNFFKKISGNAA